MYKSLFSCSVLALACASSIVQADSSNLATIAQDQTFFNVGGPNKALQNAPASAVAAAKTPDPMPDAALFTNVKNLGEQSHDNAVDVFNLKNRRQEASAPTSATTANSTGAVTGTTTAPQQGMPDPDLFTNTGTPKEQTRDHPFKLF